MRIAMLTNNYLPFIGGVPISIERLARGLRQLGHEVYVFAPAYPGLEEEDREQKVIRYKALFRHRETGFQVPNPLDPQIRKQFKTLEIDLIHVHHPMMIGNVASYLSRKYDIPLVYTYHTRYESYLHYIRLFDVQKLAGKVPGASLLAGVERKLMEWGRDSLVPNYMNRFTAGCDRILAPSVLIQTYLEATGCQSPVSRLPTGLDDRFFMVKEEAVQEVREAYGNGVEKLFCTVCRLAPEKNLSFILRSLRAYKETAKESFRMLFIGEGPSCQALEEEAAELGLEKEVLFTGQIPNARLPAYYSACDLLLFASKTETQGIVILEAMAAGLPVVAVRAGGIEDVVEDRVNGYLTDEDERVFAGQMGRVLESQEHYDRLAAGASETAREYTELNIAKQAQNIYGRAVWERRMVRSRPELEERERAADSTYLLK